MFYRSSQLTKVLSHILMFFSFQSLSMRFGSVLHVLHLVATLGSGRLFLSSEVNVFYLNRIRSMPEL